MKLANYCRNEENKQCRLILPGEELNIYDRIYYYSEFIKSVPIDIRRNKNVIYGGTALTRGEYIPFKDNYIEYMTPQIDIYKEFLRGKYTDGVKSKEINKFLESGYYRMKAGNDLLPFPPTYHNRLFYIYDRDFLTDGWENVINKLIARHVRTIIPVHPIYCKNLNDFFKIRSYNKISRTASFIFDFDIKLDVLSNYLEKNRIQLLSEVLVSTSAFVPFGGNKPTTKLYIENLIDALNRLYCYWTKGIPVKLKYIEPSLGNYNSIDSLSKIIETWTVNSICKYNQHSIVSFLKCYNQKYSEELELVQKIQNVYPLNRDLFNQTWTNLKDRRIWRV